jgi:putative flippase GtrA
MKLSFLEFRYICVDTLPLFMVKFFLRFIMKENSTFTTILPTILMVIRYGISGVGGFASNMSIFLLFFKVFQFHYLYASAVAFLGGAVVSFLLQKFFTFSNHALDGVKRQFVLHIALLSCNLIANIALVYFFVDIVGTKEIVAQALASAIIAIWSFFIYRNRIFIAPMTDADLNIGS